MSKTGQKRKITDKFYTTDKIAQFLVEKFYLRYPCARNIVEPSAGNGAFVHYLCRFKYDSSDYFSAFDIDPKNIRDNYIIPIERRDFLKYDFNEHRLAPASDSVYFIGNPPFGRQASLAKKFIKHITAWNKAKVIAFILPKSFKGIYMQKCFPLNWHLVEQIDIPANSFTIDKEEYSVQCVYQIWEKMSTNRSVPPRIKPINYQFVTQKDSPDYAIKRVGVNAGRILSNTNVSQQSHYFIKLNENTDKALFLSKYNTIKFDTDNTVGPRSISKQEFIAELNNIV